MSIKKPLGLSLLVGLMAMAFVALPAMANAAPELTNPNKSTVAVGTTITFTSSNATTVFPTVPSTTLTCEMVTVRGIVTKNTGTEVHISMDEAGSDSASGCKVNGSTAVKIEPTLTTILLTPTSGTALFHFSGAGLVEESSATVTYKSPATLIHVAGPVTGTLPGTFSGDFTITGPKGEVITAD